MLEKQGEGQAFWKYFTQNARFFALRYDLSKKTPILYMDGESIMVIDDVSVVLGESYGAI